MNGASSTGDVILLIELSLMGGLALAVRRSSACLGFEAIPGFLTAFGITIFGLSWAWFILYVVLGWSYTYILCSLGLPGFLVIWLQREIRHAIHQLILGIKNGALATFRSQAIFFALIIFVSLRFIFGIRVDENGLVWCNFNFVDTPYHLSVVNAFVRSNVFPPIDLNATPYPLKYHFLSDFFVAHFVRLGASPLRTLWLLNIIGGVVLIGSLWAAASKWLKVSARWVLLGCVVFLFLNTSLVNLIHYWLLRPDFFNSKSPFVGILMFPYFNFEFTLTNMFEPQRGLLFSMPIAFPILDVCFPAQPNKIFSASHSVYQIRVLRAFCLICLLPFAHIVTFAVTCLCFVPMLWKNRAWFGVKYVFWAPALALGLSQLLYLFYYGPPQSSSYSGWDALRSIPLESFQVFPRIGRFVIFWIFVNGDFFVWGLGIIAWVLVSSWLRPKVNYNPSLVFLVEWRWYFVVCGFCFLLINFYRYSASWGDSNKFVLFLNLGLALAIASGAAQLNKTRKGCANIIWVFLITLSIAPAAYEFYSGIVIAPHGKILMFRKSEQAAAKWLRDFVGSSEVVLTGAYDIVHFVTPLGGAPTLAGIYADSNPYLQPSRAEQIRRIYEDAAFELLDKLNVRYICVSVNERSKYKLHYRWSEMMKSGQGIAFHAGGGIEDFESVYIFDCRALAKPAQAEGS